MEFLKGLGLLLLIVAIAFTPLFGLYYIVKYVIGFFDKSIYGRKINLKYTEIVLSSKFSYYQKLNDKNKTKFLRRLHNFIDGKDFFASGGTQLTDEMIILISASAIQLTFGLEKYMLNHFSKIFVYPKEYYSKTSKKYHKGEANLAGAIVLSWSHFIEGYNKPGDKINLGLHEMAHALRFDKFKGDEYDRFFNAYYDKWQMIAREEFKKTRDQNASFFREYGGTNSNEFFAVCVESFFESPAEFKKLHPEIYNHMCILLNQDPLSNIIYGNTIEDIRTKTSGYTEITGQAFYTSGNNVKNILALFFVVIVWGYIVLKIISEGTGLDIIVIVFLSFVIGYFITLRSFCKASFFENGFIIRSLIPNLLYAKSKFSYDEIICVEFEQRDVDETNDTIRILYLAKGKIKSRSFNDSFSPNEVLRLADKLNEKKVAVKLNKYARYFKD